MHPIRCMKCKKELNNTYNICPDCDVKKLPPVIDIALLIAFLGGALYFLIWIVGLLFHSAPHVPTAAEIEHNKAQMVLESVKLKTRWGKSGFGNVMMANFTITNGSSASLISDITITCSMTAKSGAGVGLTQNTIYDSVERGKTKTIKNINMGFIDSQASSAYCKITDMKIN